MPVRGTSSARGRKRFGGTSRRKPKRGTGIHSKRKALRSADTVRKIARKAATNVLRDKRPLLHRRFNLDANANGTVALVHNQYQYFFCVAHSTGNPYTGGLCELSSQAAGDGTYPSAPQYAGAKENALTRRIPLCEEPGDVPGNFRTHKWIEGGNVHGQITLTQFSDRVGGKVRIMVLMYQQGVAFGRDDLIMQTNCSSTTTLPAQNLFDAPQRPRQYTSKKIKILRDFKVNLKDTGGHLYGGPEYDPLNPFPAGQVNGDRIIKFKVPLPKKFYYDQINANTFDPKAKLPSKWNVGFVCCAYGGNGVPSGTHICNLTFKGDLTWRNPL